MASERLIVNFVVEMAFVSTRKVNTLVLSIKVVIFVSMGNRNMSAGRDVEVDVIVSMGKKKGIARIVVVTSCAKPHTALH